MDNKNYEWAINVPIPSEVIENCLRQTITYRTRDEDTVTIVLSNGHVYKASERLKKLVQVDVTQYYPKLDF